MTIQEVLNLPTDHLEKLSDTELVNLLGDLIPASRNPDREKANMRDVKMLVNQAKKLLGQS